MDKNKALIRIWWNWNPYTLLEKVKQCSCFENSVLLLCYAQSYLTTCDPMGSSPPGSPVLGISQARKLEWVAISLSRGSSPRRDGTRVSCIAATFFTIEPSGTPAMQEIGIPGSGRCPGVGNGNPLQFSCLGNSMDRGTWCATVHGVAKSWTQLSHQH